MSNVNVQWMLKDRSGLDSWRKVEPSASYRFQEVSVCHSKGTLNQYDKLALGSRFGLTRLTKLYYLVFTLPTLHTLLSNLGSPGVKLE